MFFDFLLTFLFSSFLFFSLLFLREKEEKRRKEKRIFHFYFPLLII